MFKELMAQYKLKKTQKDLLLHSSLMIEARNHHHLDKSVMHMKKAERAINKITELNKILN